MNSSEPTNACTVIVTELEAMKEPTTTKSHSIRITLPSSSSISEFWPESQQFVALPHDLQKQVSSQLGAIYIGLMLLIVLLDGTTCQKQSQISGLAAFEHQKPWIVDTGITLWQHFRRWTTGTDRRPFHDDIVALYLQLLDLTALPTTTLASRPSTFGQKTMTLTHGLQSLLDKLDMSAENQVRLAALLIRLRSAQADMTNMSPTVTRQKRDSIAPFTINLGSTIALLCQDGEMFSTLHQDLQARTI